MEQETDNIPIVNPYLADEELRAKYPDVNFNPQIANDTRRRMLVRHVQKYGFDLPFLLAVIFSHPDPKDACLVLRDIIREYRIYLEHTVKELISMLLEGRFDNIPQVQFLDVDELRDLVYTYAPKSDVYTMCGRLANDNSIMLKQLIGYTETIKSQNERHEEDQAEIARMAHRIEVLDGGSATSSRSSASNCPSGSDGEEDDDAPFDEFDAEDKKLTDKEKRAIQRQNHEENNEAMLQWLFETMEKWFDDKKACLEYCNCVNNALNHDEIYDVHTLRMLKTKKLTPAQILESSFADDLRAIMKPKNRPSPSGIRKRLGKLAENWKNM